MPPVSIFPSFLYSFVQSDDIRIFFRYGPFHIFQEGKDLRGNIIFCPSGIQKYNDSSVFQIVSFAWAGFGASFGPVVLLALFWRRSNRQGAIAGMLTGGVMIFFWKFLVRPIGGIWNIYELLPAFIVALIVNVAVSLSTPAPEQEVTAVFDSLQAGKDAN